jgi:hypothetical protein
VAAEIKPAGPVARRRVRSAHGKIRALTWDDEHARPPKTRRRSMMRLWISTIALSVASGIIYRMGGSKEYNKLYRRIGCTLCVTLWTFLFVTENPWALVGQAICVYGALTTYWDGVFIEDNFWMHGFALGMAAFPLFFVGVSPLIIMVRAVFLAILMGIWSEHFDKDVVEEYGRGFVFIITLPILLV